MKKKANVGDQSPEALVHLRRRVGQQRLQVLGAQDQEDDRNAEQAHVVDHRHRDPVDHVQPNFNIQPNLNRTQSNLT